MKKELEILIQTVIIYKQDKKWNLGFKIQKEKKKRHAYDKVQKWSKTLGI